MIIYTLFNLPIPKFLSSVRFVPDSREGLPDDSTGRSILLYSPMRIDEESTADDDGRRMEFPSQEKA
jgi:hypothetical protein